MNEKQKLKEIIDVASGRVAADLAIKNGKIVDVFNKEIFEGTILIKNGKFVGFGGDDFPKAKKEIDAEGHTIVPGLIDSHVHIESSHLSPGEFARLVVPCGTTTVIADPHEICNVCGVDGLDYLLKASEGLPLSVYLMFPSCVPATPFENAGAILTAKEIQSRIDNPRVHGLGELMNYPGVEAADDGILDKIMVARNAGKVIDGHSPGITGSTLDSYSASGVLTDHECDTAKELKERIRRGMYVLLREGSACHNVLNLLKGVTNQNNKYCLFCTDDRQPKSILEEGHIDNNIRISIGAGLDPLTAVCMATINAATCYRLYDRGAIAPGYRADFVLVDDLKSFNVKSVYTAGKCVAENGKYLFANPKIAPEKVSGKMNIKDFNLDKLKLALKSNKVRAIEIIPGGVVTGEKVITVERDDNNLWIYNPKQDIVKLAVVERHKGTGNVGVALLANYGLKNGAVAISIAHDSHNVMVAGDNDSDMIVAVKELERLGGGIALVQNGKILDSFCLEIAGLMTDLSGEEVDKRLTELHDIAQKKLSINKDIDPIMTLCFMALPVIPDLKLTDLGLFDVRKFSFVPNEC